MSREHTFRWDEQMSVLWAGLRSYPASYHRHSFWEDVPLDSEFRRMHPDYRMETRQAWVHFENQWQLSVIWGDATYSSNSMFITSSLTGQLGPRPFEEEPVLVEVGVLMPTPIVHPAQEFDLGERGKQTIPERESALWGDPFGYVTVPEFHRVADLVMHLPVEIDVPAGEWENAEGFCDFLITAGLERTW